MLKPIRYVTLLLFATILASCNHSNQSHPTRGWQDLIRMSAPTVLKQPETGAELRVKIYNDSMSPVCMLNESLQNFSPSTTSYTFRNRGGGTYTTPKGGMVAHQDRSTTRIEPKHSEEFILYYDPDATLLKLGKQKGAELRVSLVAEDCFTKDLFFVHSNWISILQSPASKVQQAQ